MKTIQECQKSKFEEPRVENLDLLVLLDFHSLECGHIATHVRLSGSHARIAGKISRRPTGFSWIKSCSIRPKGRILLRKLSETYVRSVVSRQTDRHLKIDAFSITGIYG